MLRRVNFYPRRAPTFFLRISIFSFNNQSQTHQRYSLSRFHIPILYVIYVSLILSSESPRQLSRTCPQRLVLIVLRILAESYGQVSNHPPNRVDSKNFKIYLLQMVSGYFADFLMKYNRGRAFSSPRVKFRYLASLVFFVARTRRWSFSSWAAAYPSSLKHALATSIMCRSGKWHVSELFIMPMTSRARIASKLSVSGQVCRISVNQSVYVTSSIIIIDRSQTYVTSTWTIPHRVGLAQVGRKKVKHAPVMWSIPKGCARASASIFECKASIDMGKFIN